MKLAVRFLGLEIFAVESSESAADGLSHIVLPDGTEVDLEAVQETAAFGFCKE